MKVNLLPIVLISILIHSSCVREAEVDDVSEEKSGGGCAMCKSENEKENSNQ